MKKTLSRTNLATAVREYLTEFIIDNDLGPGDPLPPETQLAQELGIGRSSVREAVKALQALGVVEARQGDGLYVREYNLDPILETLTYRLRWDPTTLSEFVQIRVWLETAVIGDVVKQISEERLQRLDDLLDAWAEKVKDSQPYAEDDRQFHRTLYQTLGNTTLIKLLDVFWIAFDNVGIESIKQVLDPLKTLRDHQAVLEAVRKHDESLAQQRLRESFFDIQERIAEAQEESASG